MIFTLYIRSTNHCPLASISFLMFYYKMSVTTISHALSLYILHGPSSPLYTHTHTH
ncbi:hypothetical protein BD770DRAFT_208048 [Pilaira anomala]|nr:hypothetical protein BD770DRAFT_208048 [Pilaira anomala]